MRLPKGWVPRYIKTYLFLYPCRFKTTEYKPYMFLVDLTEWIRNVVPPDISHHVGPLCPNSDCTTTASEVHVLNLDQSQPVYCCNEPVSEDDVIQQWVVPPVSVCGSANVCKIQCFNVCCFFYMPPKSLGVIKSVL